MKIRQVEKLELEKFAETANKEIGCNIPATYFLNQDCWVVQNESGAFVSGFAVITRKIPRTLEQTKDFKIIQRYKGKVAEITAYFMTTKQLSVAFTARLVIQAIKSRKTIFIFAYNIHLEKLRQYYYQGNPERVYVGCYKDQNTEKLESVEVMTIWGILRIFAHRTFKILKRKINGKMRA